MVIRLRNLEIDGNFSSHESADKRKRQRLGYKVIKCLRGDSVAAVEVRVVFSMRGPVVVKPIGPCFTRDRIWPSKLD